MHRCWHLRPNHWGPFFLARGQLGHPGLICTISSCNCSRGSEAAAPPHAPFSPWSPSCLGSILPSPGLHPMAKDLNYSWNRTLNSLVLVSLFYVSANSQPCISLGVFFFLTCACAEMKKNNANTYMVPFLLIVFSLFGFPVVTFRGASPSTFLTVNILSQPLCSGSLASLELLVLSK